MAISLGKSHIDHFPAKTPSSNIETWKPQSTIRKDDLLFERYNIYLKKNNIQTTQLFFKIEILYQYDKQLAHILQRE